MALNNLAAAYHDAGKLPRAIELYEKVRDACVAKLGADHPETLITLANLALAYQKAGKLPQALQLFEQARDAFQQMGVSFDTVLWTLGSHDIVAILDAPDAETVAAALVQLAGAGNVSTETLRGFTPEEMGGILRKVG